MSLKNSADVCERDRNLEMTEIIPPSPFRTGLVTAGLAYIKPGAPPSCGAHLQPIMEPTVTSPLLLLVASLAFLVLYHSARRSSSNPKRLPLPPGPPREFVLGNARHVPSSTPWKTYTKWKKTYGDIVYTRIVNQHNIILNSYGAAKELMERTPYSGRYSPVMIDKLMDMNQGLVSINYGNQWRKYRKLMNPYMHKIGIDRYFPVQEKGTCRYLQTLLDHPEDFTENWRLKTAREIAMVTYGITEDAAVEEYISTSEKVAIIFLKALLPGSFLVNTIPQLRYIPDWFPGANFKRVAASGKIAYLEMINRPVKSVKAKMAAGTFEPSITSELLERGEDEDVVKKMNGSIYSAATDTTVKSMTAFISAMTLYPEVVKKAQAELDSVVGPTRLPTTADHERLPYVNAVFMEVLRWIPATPLGIAHRLLEDDEYEGYFIPRDSIVYTNIWAMSRDEAHYKDPETFRPERFLVPDKEELDPRLFVFGLGRRACIGKHFAESTLFIAFASILATFDISKARDENGREIEPDVNFHMRAERFKCTIKPRSNVAAALIRDAAAADF
ncbi:hypothetical protein BOTBODRAFT_62111 [Botryobasidium botryosum FD-172 SS1]|uniref:Cytochrome P450 n=1 Tax=Botryobasidium botryosum (strain FD-172 SS1) TaxID=930990 RepID=A0A067MZN2_BOTB1|nr:hypothetical protein BOTBODRAFT_62111 [Botryobasidium botryosum FD-172 SS1]